MSLSNLPIKTIKRNRATKPEDIFKALILRGDVQGLWSPQGKALEEWHEKRRLNDIIVDMTTGGGKTLVGLLIAQSLVNETSGKVVYVCPTVQLAEQTAAVAAECGIAVSLWVRGQWQSPDHYDGCNGCCVTTYAAVFRGGSYFKDQNLQGIIFDDGSCSTQRPEGTIHYHHR